MVSGFFASGLVPTSRSPSFWAASADGLAAFAYAAFHVSLYVGDHKFDLIKVGSEIAMRIYLTVGFLAVLGLTALAATSTDGMVRRLGVKWKRLHRLAYVVAGLGLVRKAA